MNRLINLDVLVLLILLTSCNTQINVADEKQAVKDTLTAMWEAIEQENVERYATYIHENFSQFGETDTTLKIGKRDEVEGVREWVKRISIVLTKSEYGHHDAPPGNHEILFFETESSFLF